MISLQIWVAMDSEVSSEQTQVSTEQLYHRFHMKLGPMGRGKVCACACPCTYACPCKVNNNFVGCLKSTKDITCLIL